MRGAAAESFVKLCLFEGQHKWRREDIAWWGKCRCIRSSWRSINRCYFCSAFPCFASNSPTGFVYPVAFEIKTVNLQVVSGSNTQYGMYPANRIRYTRSATHKGMGALWIQHPGICEASVLARQLDQGVLCSPWDATPQFLKTIVYTLGLSYLNCYRAPISLVLFSPLPPPPQSSTSLLPLPLLKPFPLFQAEQQFQKTDPVLFTQL